MKEDVKVSGEYCLTFKNEQGEVTKQITKKNLVVNTGLSLVAQLLMDSGEFTSPKINYCAVGTGSTVPASGDTQLETEIGRKLFTAQSVQGNSILLSVYFTKLEAVGTLAEIGLFFNGEGTADSGILFSRIAGGTELPITKNDTETLTIDYKLTIN